MIRNLILLLTAEQSACLLLASFLAAMIMAVQSCCCISTRLSGGASIAVVMSWQREGVFGITVGFPLVLKHNYFFRMHFHLATILSRSCKNNLGNLVRLFISFSFFFSSYFFFSSDGLSYFVLVVAVMICNCC